MTAHQTLHKIQHLEKRLRQERNFRDTIRQNLTAKNVSLVKCLREGENDLAGELGNSIKVENLQLQSVLKKIDKLVKEISFLKEVYSTKMSRLGY